MNNTKTVIAVSNTPASSPGIIITLESAGIFLGILVSASVLITGATNLVTKMSQISSSIKRIEEELKTHASNAEKVRELDKRLDLHLQDYVNRKDLLQMLFGQINEKVDHKFKKLLFYTRDIQRFLQRDTDFKIRDYEENPED
ncbi:hypothetical protein I8748_16425 [Nostoc sp. CENA67]|uniref:Uncharacterized protein n=1 Tax=Amazonocrinis nigriterrae CENA67 TaxID=2794033 RepID=A0A8J7HQH0_9NOST|nr:hypothetical protein [Amazonocrinis nigriterrae]MBH8563757.1 hypothetical protein [Amazonocrinis nigriterrae CENA67]